MTVHFRNALMAVQDSLTRIDPTADPHTFNQFKALQLIAQGLDQMLGDQQRELQALRHELQYVRGEIQSRR